ncbi:molybdenum cofactor biosysynthesis protein [Marmoricola endophyticus]|uniref:Molybdenum cofactor biosysynthesis protein n=1 Tax=Marmoricola endophyticus TaxID=2040280 RepID=A0A917BJ85_9ACTN|nr:MOSC N-terminal beta barrel domain-containing protein [Marmoricola endophyticus]GGF42743.1 molybdenum cofactor biosysynthesis protein [Marmoricola endophyticus]
MQLTSIRRYPVKSMRGADLDTAAVEPWGLADDRRWMVVDEDGRFVTARELPRLLLVTPTVTAGGLCLDAADAPPLEVARPADGGRTVTVWRSTFEAYDAGPAAAAWLSDLLGRPLRLVHLADPTVRASDPAYSREGDVVSLADGYPLLLATEASLGALNDTVLESSGGAADPLPMTRFRPNVVVGGSAPWTEDDWRRVRIGEATFRVVKGCARCVMTTKDPETAEGGKEPLASLARTRRWDGQTWFGVNLVPDALDPAHRPLLRAGDGVEVLDVVEPGGGPIR